MTKSHVARAARYSNELGDTTRGTVDLIMDSARGQFRQDKPLLLPSALLCLSGPASILMRRNGHFDATAVVPVGGGDQESGYV